MTAEGVFSSRWRAVVAPLVLLLIVIGFFWKLLLTNQYSWLETPDIAWQVVPWFQYQAFQFHQHVIPLWDPFQYGGQSLIGQNQPGLAYPLNWILYLLPLRDGHISFGWLNWYFMSIHYLAALFCYFLCRDLGRGTIASMIGGVSFGLGGYVGNVDWPQMINGAIWAPLVFLFLFRAARKIRPFANAALSGLFLGCELAQRSPPDSDLSFARCFCGLAVFTDGRRPPAHCPPCPCRSRSDFHSLCGSSPDVANLLIWPRRRQMGWFTARSDRMEPAGPVYRPSAIFSGSEISVRHCHSRL